jgi:hypothetical protein
LGYYISFLNLFYYYIKAYYTNIILGYHKIGEKEPFQAGQKKE